MAAEATTGPCPVCGEAATFAPKRGDYTEVSCERCGAYTISGTWAKTFESLSADERLANLEEAKRRARLGDVPFIGPDGQ